MGYIHQDAMGHIQFLKNIDDTVDGKIQLTCWYGKYPIRYIHPRHPRWFSRGISDEWGKIKQKIQLVLLFEATRITNWQPESFTSASQPLYRTGQSVQELSKSIFRSDKPWITSWPYTSCMQPGVLKTPKNGCKRKNGRCFLKHNKY